MPFYTPLSECLMLEKLTTFFSSNPKKSSTNQPLVIPRDQHTISRQHVSKAALDVLYGLHKSGYQAYLVGGCIRDLLLNKHPKDFDVATDATPEEVKALFKRSRIIGRRFRIVHVNFGGETIEVTTFRGQPDNEATQQQHTQSQSGLLLRDNVFGSIEEDALRRDFTINAFYYNIADFSLIDFVGGLDDLSQQRIRLIGNPEVRYREDPVRILRALRFVAKLDFELDDKTAKPIQSLKPLLLQISPARLFDEQIKLFMGGYAERCYDQLIKHDVLAFLFPASADLLQGQQRKKWEPFVRAALQNTDQRIAEGKRVTPAFLLAVLLWPMLQQHSNKNLQQVASQVLSQQNKVLSIPKRFSFQMRDIWSLQSRLERRRRPLDVLEHPRFRAAYDFLQLREQNGLVEPSGITAWWHDFQFATPEHQQTLIKQLTGSKSAKRRPRKRKAPAKKGQA